MSITLVWSHKFALCAFFTGHCFSLEKKYKKVQFSNLLIGHIWDKREKCFREHYLPVVNSLKNKPDQSNWLYKLSLKLSCNLLAFINLRGVPCHVSFDVIQGLSVTVWHLSTCACIQHSRSDQDFFWVMSLQSRDRTLTRPILIHPTPDCRRDFGCGKQSSFKKLLLINLLLLETEYFDKGKSRYIEFYFSQILVATEPA